MINMRNKSWWLHALIKHCINQNPWCTSLQLDCLNIMRSMCSLYRTVIDRNINKLVLFDSYIDDFFPCSNGMLFKYCCCKFLSWYIAAVLFKTFLISIICAIAKCEVSFLFLSNCFAHVVDSFYWNNVEWFY